MRTGEERDNGLKRIWEGKGIKGKRVEERWVSGRRMGSISTTLRSHSFPSLNTT
jgi:hypothetical protein